MSAGSPIRAKIDKDYIFDPEDPTCHTQVGREFDEHSLLGYWDNEYSIQQVDFDGGTTRFRLKDDDGVTYYGGWLYDDVDCLMQTFILKWAESWAGCTTIEIKDINGRWQQVIG